MCACQTVTVHLTPSQLERLEFLIERRIGDLHFLFAKFGITPETMTGSDRAEMADLKIIKRELQHAGT